jgi:uncharacterized protein YrzB (UPF0473 family)
MNRAGDREQAEPNRPGAMFVAARHPVKTVFAGDVLSSRRCPVMSEEYGSDYITIVDEDGHEFELEHLETLEFEGETYMAFLPADMDENDEDYGIIILKSVVENGEEVLGSVDDEKELDRVYDHFMEVLFSDEDEDTDEDKQ